MKTWTLIIIGASLTLLASSIFTALSFETITSEPPENLPEGMVPIQTEVGKANPFGAYAIYSSLLVLIGTGIYSLIDFLKRRKRN